MGKPKKPASGFIRYLVERFAGGDQGSKTYREFQQQIVSEWSAMDPQKKQVYNDACKAESEVYRKELAKWELKMVRMGNVDLVRQEALIEAVPNKKSQVGLKVAGRPKAGSKKNKLDSSDSD